MQVNGLSPSASLDPVDLAAVISRLSDGDGDESAVAARWKSMSVKRLLSGTISFISSLAVSESTRMSDKK